jgi:protein SCO1/2
MRSSEIRDDGGRGARSILRQGLSTWWRSAVLVTLLAAVSFAATSRPEAARPLPRLGRVADFSLTDQDGAAVTRKSLAGEPWVASFFFTRCPTVCPLITSRMQRLDRLASADDAPLRLVSITVDPEHDGSAVLEEYAKTHHVDWAMLTGSEDAVRRLAQSFAVAMEGKADPDELNYGILHSGHLILVDGDGVIRGYYGSAEADVEERILADARRAGAAERRKSPRAEATQRRTSSSPRAPSPPAP